VRAAGPPYKSTTLCIMKNPNPSRTLAAQLFAAVVILAFANRALAEVHYVDMKGTNATPPFTNWATAATNIQDAVDAAVAADEVVVTNGTYATGGRLAAGDPTRLVMDKPVNVRSVNGAQFTTIIGAGGRCVYLTNGASLSGFTLTEGAADEGGGLWCESQTAVASNCVVTGNTAYTRGGGAYQGTLINCSLIRNLANPYYNIDGSDIAVYGGGAFGCALNGCALVTNLATITLTDDYPFTGNASAFGGGAAQCVLSNCMLAGNSASIYNQFTLDESYAYGLYANRIASSGGAFDCALTKCVLTGNSARNDYRNVYYSFFQPFSFAIYSTASGGGAAGSTLANCLLVGNSAGNSYNDQFYPVSGLFNAFTLTGSSVSGGGASGCALNNCALRSNEAWTLDLDYFIWSRISHYISGGGADSGALDNCTLSSNSGVGATGCALRNCISYFNSVSNYDGSDTLRYCCTTPQPTHGVNNITNAPLFMDTNGWANLRLQPNSPCINAGNNSYVTNATDLDGNPRISGGTVDIGAYEYQWPQLTIAPSGPNVLLTWPTNNAGYDYTGFSLQSTTNLLSPAVWTTNSSTPVVIAGQNTVTNPTTGAQQFYRLAH
jgi:hypothetical protein